MPRQPTDQYRISAAEEEIARRTGRQALETRLQPDPVLDGSGPSAARVAIIALAVAVILGAYYSLHSTARQNGIDPGARSAPAQTAAPPNEKPGTR